MQAKTWERKEKWKKENKQQNIKITDNEKETAWLDQQLIVYQKSWLYICLKATPICRPNSDRRVSEQDDRNTLGLLLCGLMRTLRAWMWNSCFNTLGLLFNSGSATLPGDSQTKPVSVTRNVGSPPFSSKAVVYGHSLFLFLFFCLFVLFPTFNGQ